MGGIDTGEACYHGLEGALVLPNEGGGEGSGIDLPYKNCSANEREVYWVRS